MIDTWYGRFAEDLFEFLVKPDMHVGMKAPSGQSVPGFGTPKPLVSPYGPNYSMHPELSRPAIGYITSRLTVPVVYLATPIVLAEANRAVIESAPEEQQRGLWMMFSSALTGTFGGDYSGLF